MTLNKMGLNPRYSVNFRKMKSTSKGKKRRHTSSYCNILTFNKTGSSSDQRAVSSVLQFFYCLLYVNIYNCNTKAFLADTYLSV